MAVRERVQYLRDIEFLKKIFAASRAVDLCVRESVLALNESEALLTQVEHQLNGPINQDVASRLVANSLQFLVHSVIEENGGKARAAFYLADVSGRTLHHITGMPEAYAKCVDGFAIGPQSLACGLAAATQEAIITRDVLEEPRWKPWLWLAKEFKYRACWSFPVQTSAGNIHGSLVIYHEEPTDATQRDLVLAAALTRRAANIVARYRTLSGQSGY
jgi:two-component system CheB/CheR fusion protein